MGHELDALNIVNNLLELEEGQVLIIKWKNQTKRFERLPDE